MKIAIRQLSMTFLSRQTSRFFMEGPPLGRPSRRPYLQARDNTCDERAADHHG
jgi:hypothetical protein